MERVLAFSQWSCEERGGAKLEWSVQLQKVKQRWAWAVLGWVTTWLQKLHKPPTCSSPQLFWGRRSLHTLSSFPTPSDESINRGLVWVHIHKIILRLKRSWHWCPGDDISAGYRHIPSMHLPEVRARLPMRGEYKRPCSQKSTPLGVLARVNSLWLKQTNLFLCRVGNEGVKLHR